jgi:DNA polymerase-3 subunit delta'
VAFDSLLGHDRIRALLSRTVAAGRVPPALLLAGPRGVGKKMLALAVARALVCERQDGDTCGSCSACGRAARGIHPDVFLVEPETTAIRIDQVRELARQLAARSFEGRARAFVVDEAHLLTEEASNALLKGLEEPPQTSHVLLVTAAPQALLPTIRSRCQLFRLRPLPVPLVEAYLRERTGLAPEEARLRAALCSGSLGAALAFESEGYKSVRERLLALLEGAGQRSPLARLETAEWLAGVDDLELALEALRSLLRDATALRAGAAEGTLLNRDVSVRLARVARTGLGGRAVEVAERAGEALLALRKGNVNKLLAMDVLVEALAGA